MRDTVTRTSTGAVPLVRVRNKDHWARLGIRDVVARDCSNMKKELHYIYIIVVFLDIYDRVYTINVKRESSCYGKKSINKST